MEPTRFWSPPQQQQEPSSLVAGYSDSLHWDAAAELLAFIDDPELVESPDDAIPEDVGGTESLIEEDFEFVVRSNSKRTLTSPVVAAESVNEARDGSPSATTASQPTEVATSAVGRRLTANQTVRSRAKSGAKTNASTALTFPTTRNTSLDEAQRERNRLKVRRLYYRKLDQMNALRTQVVDLEEKLESIKLTQNSRNNTELSVVTVTPLSESGVDYADLLRQLISTKQRLQHENEYLRRIVSQHVKSVHAISVKLMQQRVPSVAHLTIKSVTLQECTELHRQTLSQLHKFAQRKAMFTYAGSICGWHSSHFIQNSTFQFSMEKVQPYYSADQIGERVWAVLCDPDQYAHLFSTAVGMKCYVLQTIDADNFVVFHEFRTMNPLEEHQVIVRTILLVSRVRSESESFLIAATSLDQDKWVLEDMTTSPQDTVFWSYLSCYMQYTDVPESSGCACLFAGHMPIIGSNVGFWTLEMVQLAVRWERMAIGSGSYSLLPTTTDE